MEDENPAERGFCEADDGLGPTTFCMANASDCSHPFAESPYLQVILKTERTQPEPERTTSVTIVTTPCVSQRSGERTAALIPYLDRYTYRRRHGASATRAGRDLNNLVRDDI